MKIFSLFVTLLLALNSTAQAEVMFKFKQRDYFREEIYPICSSDDKEICEERAEKHMKSVLNSRGKQIKDDMVTHLKHSGEWGRIAAKGIAGLFYAARGNVKFGLPKVRLGHKNGIKVRFIYDGGTWGLFREQEEDEIKMTVTYDF